MQNFRKNLSFRGSLMIANWNQIIKDLEVLVSIFHSSYSSPVQLSTIITTPSRNPVF